MPPGHHILPPGLATGDHLNSQRVYRYRRQGGDAPRIVRRTGKRRIRNFAEGSTWEDMNGGNAMDERSVHAAWEEFETSLGRFFGPGRSKSPPVRQSCERNHEKFGIKGR